MAVRVDGSLDGIDWVQAKADPAADDFDNGRSPQALRASFDRSQHVAIAALARSYHRVGVEIHIPELTLAIRRRRAACSG